jgi:hypothetical protein
VNIGDKESEMGAFTCATVRSAETSARSEIVPESGGYVARVSTMEFYSEMDRQCSWWNPKFSALPQDYILQHEQIHFAIIEAQARRIEQRVLALRGRGRTPEAAAADLQRSIDAVMEASTEETLERSTEFDEDTSYRYEPERQAEWLAEVEAELARTAR